MKEKWVIRINRTNEFNWAWAFLLVFQLGLIFCVTLVTNKYAATTLMLGGLLNFVLALMYQGFEVIKE